MITVRYTCLTCKVIDRGVQVYAREGPNIDVKWWMEQVVVLALSRDHLSVSPCCPATQLDELKVPLADGLNSFVGQQTNNVPPVGVSKLHTDKKKRKK